MAPQTIEGTRSAEKLKNIANKRLKVNQDDWEANEILGFVYQKKGEMFERSNISDNEENDQFLSNLCELISL